MYVGSKKTERGYSGLHMAHPDGAPGEHTIGNEHQHRVEMTNTHFTLSTYGEACVN